MGANSTIEWCDATWSPWWGCQRVSPGCEKCYAETFSKRVGHGKRLPMIWGPGAERRLFREAHWDEPLKWDRAAVRAGERRRVFCASMADVFEIHRDVEMNTVLNVERRKLWRLIEETPRLDWLLLTKRPENVLALVDEAWLAAFPPNVWLGTTVEDQRRANERLPVLFTIPAHVRFLSCEPLLEAVDLFGAPAPDDTGPFGPAWRQRGVERRTDYGTGTEHDVEITPGIDWVIGGSESGPGARPMKIEWLASLRDQCARAGVPFFTKQIATPQDRKGGDPTHWPEGPWPREFPEVSP